MSQSQKSIRPREQCESHNFPAMDRAGRQGDSNHTLPQHFQPLFKCSPNSCYSPALPSSQKTECELDPDEKEKVFSAGFQNGYEAGKEDGCRSAQESIGPHLIDFLQAFENVSAFHRHLTQNASRQVIQLAIHICEHILASDIQTEYTNTDAICIEIQNMMTEAHQLTLHFDPKDLKVLEDMMGCFDLRWPESKTVVIESGRLTSKRNKETDNKQMPQITIRELIAERLPQLLD
jgi:hypothetical protein